MVEGENLVWKRASSLPGWREWSYAGKGPKWICFGCKKYTRGPLYSRQEASSDATYGVVGYNPQRWERFEWIWLCKSCIRRLGYLW